MHVYTLQSLDELARYAEDWDRLADGNPLRGWAWLSTWWRHYGGRAAGLRAACVFDESDRLVGVGPWYAAASAPFGRVSRMLGDGEVCTDHLGLLAAPRREDAVAMALADELNRTARGAASDQRWDAICWEGIDAADHPMDVLARRLADDGHRVERRAGPACWRLDLPRSWDAYLAGLSKRRRHALRKLERCFIETGRARLHVVERAADLPAALDALIELHQRRRRSLGQRGCFTSPPFRAMIEEVSPLLLSAGQLRLSWLEVDGRRVAAEYQLSGAGVLYVYQAGIDPERLDLQPGNLITMMLIRQAIEQGCTAFDFLRGDEPYKAHFGARPRAAVAVEVVADRPAARWRHRVFGAPRRWKRLLKTVLQPAESPEP